MQKIPEIPRNMCGSPQVNLLLQIPLELVALNCHLRQWRLDSQNRETIEKWEQEDRASGAPQGWKMFELFRADHHYHHRKQGDPLPPWKYRDAVDSWGRCYGRKTLAESLGDMELHFGLRFLEQLEASQPHGLKCF